MSSDWYRKTFIFLIPLIQQKKISNITMLDSISSHVEFIQGDNVFWIVVPDVVVNAEFALDGFICSEQVSDLNIEFFILSAAYEIYFFIACFSYCNGVSAAKGFQIHDIFQNQIDVPHVSAIDGLTNSVIGDVVLFVGRKKLFSLKILTLDLIEQISIAAIFDVIQDRFRSDRALLAFRNFASAFDYTE